MFGFLKIFEFISPFSVLLINIGLVHEAYLIIKNKTGNNISILYFCLVMLVDSSWALYGLYLDNWFMIFSEALALCISVIIILLSLYYGKDS
jgi:uncharacterized protein with PQ loop repeat